MVPLPFFSLERQNPPANNMAGPIAIILQRGILHFLGEMERWWKDTILCIEGTQKGSCFGGIVHLACPNGHGSGVVLRPGLRSGSEINGKRKKRTACEGMARSAPPSIVHAYCKSCIPFLRTWPLCFCVIIPSLCFSDCTVCARAVYQGSPFVERTYATAMLREAVWV